MSRSGQLAPTVVIEAEAYLSQSCRVMAGLIRTHGPCPLADREFRPFQTLANSIISQQLSAKAADTIERRVQAIVPGFTPAEFLAGRPSAAKAGPTLSDLADKAATVRVNFDLDRASRIITKH